MENNQEKPKRTRKKEVLEPTIEEVSSHSLSTDEIIQNEIQKYSVADAVISELKVKFKGLKIKGIDDKKGYEEVKKAQLIMRDYRTSVEKKRTELKADSIKIGKGIDEEARRLTALIAEVEDPLKEKRQAIDDAKKAEEERIEREAEEKFQNRIKELEAVGISFDGSFYSIGDSISVDVFTVKEFTDEVFEDFKKRVSAENEKIKKAESIKNLHNERREKALPFLAYWTEEEKSINFGEVGDVDFDGFMERIQKAESDFKDKIKRQEDEAKQQIADRKALNYEKRSFQLEKEGFEEREKGNWAFVTESGSVGADKGWLETADKEEWESSFENMKFKKAEYLKASEELDEQRKQKAEADAKKKADEEAEKEFYNKWNSRILSFKKLGFEHLGSILKFDSIEVNVNDFKEIADEEFSDMLIDATKQKAEIEKEIAEKEEAERLQKLPEIEKAERYIEEVMKVKIPQVNGSEIAEILSEFKNKIKLASDEATSNLKNL